MNLLIISQVFWPSTSSVSQHLTDLAEELAGRKHKVHVLTSRKDYENPILHYKRTEAFQRVTIERLWQTGFDKSSKVGRLLNFASFNLMLFFRLLLLRRGQYEIIIGLTAPPLVSFFGVIAAKLKDARFCYWTMDLQPELAIVSGYLKEGSVTAKDSPLIADSCFQAAVMAVTPFDIRHARARAYGVSALSALLPLLFNIEF